MEFGIQQEKDRYTDDSSHKNYRVIHAFGRFYERLLMLAVEEWGNTETQTDRVPPLRGFTF